MLRPACPLCDEFVCLVTDDLKVISSCGHVFHGFCLHRWMGKRIGGSSIPPACPVCKQRFCPQTAVQRLFFGSHHQEEREEECNHHAHIKRIKPEAKPDNGSKTQQAKINALQERLLSHISAIQNQKSIINQLKEEIHIWKSKAKNEKSLKEEINSESGRLQQKLNTATEEFSRKTEECLELQEIIKTLNKELVEIKLLTHWELQEVNMMELMSIDHGMSYEDVIEFLMKTLTHRNKQYKEAENETDVLDQGAKRILKKYIRRKEKIQRLKAQLAKRKIDVKD